MPRAEAGSVKAIGNAIKARGLTKLRFYCQICQKACRDENGYKNHIESESHMRQIAAIGSAGKVIDNFSREFQNGFVSLLSRRFGTAKINANRVYQEYIQDRHHLHMNATRWVSLSEFVKHLGRQGIAHVEEITDEGQHGWYISWIDNSPKALARQDALQKMQRAKMDEEGRMRKYLKEQIERAKESDCPLDEERVNEGLKRQDDGVPLKIGLSSKETDENGASASASPPTTTTKASPPSDIGSKPPQTNAPAPFKFGINPLKQKPAESDKKTPPKSSENPLKSRPKPTAAPVSASSSRTSSMTAAERIMAEEKEKKEKRKFMGPQPSAHVKRSRF